ncbi:MAG TPA: SOS response-associated peptidase [Candidatus Didemnitutus sp.]|nr:SOS response-associated peptidase [Candidatus Didemnitutus sp.]
MCTRYSLTNLQAMREMLKELGLNTPESLSPRFNIAPSQRVPVVTKSGVSRVEEMTFGFTLPARSEAEKPTKLLNARAETLLDRPAFRDATRHRRCLVPADGFYEWGGAGAARLPHYFFLPKHPAFFFAGLWEPATDAVPASFAVVTTTANEVLRPMHDRMPVILGPNSGRNWLGDEPLEANLLARLCRPLPAEMMSSRRVDPRVNNARYEAPDCVQVLTN